MWGEFGIMGAGILRVDVLKQVVCGVCKSVNRNWIRLVGPKRDGGLRCRRAASSLVTGSLFNLSSFDPSVQIPSCGCRCRRGLSSKPLMAAAVLGGHFQ